MKPDKLYLKPVGGLCNRMRAVDSAITLATQLGKQLIVFWGRDIHLNCRYSDLFKPCTQFRVIEEEQWLGKKALFPYLPGSRPSSTFRKTLYSITKQALNIKSEIWFEDFEKAVLPLSSEVKPEKIRSMQEYELKSLPYILPLLAPLQNSGNHFVCTAWRLAPEQHYDRHFTPINTLAAKVTNATKGFDNTIGVHIRRSDHEHAIAYSRLDKFMHAMDEELRRNSDTTFYLATECRETEVMLHEKYPGKIYTYPKDSYSRDSTSGMQDALVDLYSLSRTQKVLGSYFSSFSQVAADISGIEEVTVY